MPWSVKPLPTIPASKPSTVSEVIGDGVRAHLDTSKWVMDSGVFILTDWDINENFWSCKKRLWRKRLKTNVKGTLCLRLEIR
jgi:hypothetical protein